jgi:hypothetical protein
MPPMLLVLTWPLAASLLKFQLLRSITLLI